MSADIAFVNFADTCLSVGEEYLIGEKTWEAACEHKDAEFAAERKQLLCKLEESEQSRKQYFAEMCEVIAKNEQLLGKMAMIEEALKAIADPDSNHPIFFREGRVGGMSIDRIYEEIALETLSASQQDVEAFLNEIRADVWESVGETEFPEAFDGVTYSEPNQNSIQMYAYKKANELRTKKTGAEK